MASPISTSSMTKSGGIVNQVKKVLTETLQLGDRGANMGVDTPLIGNIPELDSMAIVTVITALEETFHFIVNDDDDLAHAFQSLGNLIEYLTEKTNNI